MTTITMPDTVTLLEPYFISRAHPKDLFAEVEANLLAPDGFLRRVQAITNQIYGWDILNAAYPEPVVGSQAYGLFNPQRSREAVDWIFARFKSEDVSGRIKQGVARALAELDYPLPEIEVLLFPVNTASPVQMKAYHGLYCLPGAPGSLQVLLWPSDSNLARLDAVLAHAVAVNHRAAMFGLWSLRDWLVAEGLAAHLVAKLHPALDLPWLVDFHTPDGWQAEQIRLADLHNVSHFDAIKTNIYGNIGTFADLDVPPVLALDAEEHAYVYDVISKGLGATNPVTIAAYVYGDAFVSPQGHPAIGLMPYASFEYAYRQVQAYLQQSGDDLRAALMRPVEAVISPGLV